VSDLLISSKYLDIDHKYTYL